MKKINEEDVYCTHLTHKTVQILHNTEMKFVEAGELHWLNSSSMIGDNDECDDDYCDCDLHDNCDCDVYDDCDSNWRY